MINLLNRGIIPRDVDLTPAFNRGANPFNSQPMRFFKKSATPIKDEVQTGKTFVTSVKYGGEGIEERKTTKLPSLKKAAIANVKVQSLALPEAESKPLAIEYDMKKDTAADYEANPRTYNELLDEYSLHQFMIRKGKVMENTPEFISYKRKYMGKWGGISYVIHLLENILSKAEIPFAMIDGKKVYRLALDESEQLPKHKLLECIVNSESILSQIKLPSLEFEGDNGKAKAAIFIQKCYKMHAAKIYYAHCKFLKSACLKISSAYQMYKSKIKTREAILNQEQETMNKWKHIQEEFKKNWPEIKYKKRIEIHINSLSFSEDTRISMEKLQQRQNMQFARILALKNPQVDVIYISPYNISDDIIGYYMKVLELRNANSQSRLTIVTPENSLNLPSHLPLAKMLLFSQKSIQRIRSLIKGNIAYIVPGVVSMDEVKLSCILEVPLLSGDPQLSQLYSTKSGSRRVFNSADIPIPAGQYDIYDDKEFEITLTKLMLSQPAISTWVFKIDDEFEGRGIAYLNVDTIESLKKVRKKGSEITEDIIQRVHQKIHKILPKKAVVAMPSLYQSWNEYLTAFCKRGGVIEAMPSSSSLETHSPSVSFLIEPDGKIQVLGSYDRFNGKEFLNAGCFYPQTSLPDINLESISNAVGQSLYSKGIIGYITVDLLSFPYKSDESSHPLFWGIGLSCFLNNYTSYIQFFEFLMNGKLNNTSGQYSIQKGQDVEERHFMCLNHLHHPGLAALPYKTFFHMCRIEAISFELENLTGITFLLSDSLQSGILTVLAIAQTSKQCLKYMIDTINFIMKQAGNLPQKKAITLGEARMDDMHGHETISHVRLLWKNLDKKGSV